MRITSLGVALAASTCIVALSTPADAQQSSFNIPAGSLKSALDTFGRQSRRPIIYKADDVRGVRSPGYRGTASTEEVLRAILASTGFTARTGAGDSVAIVRVGNGQSTGIDAPPSGQIAANNGNTSAYDGDIVVTAQKRSERLQDVPFAVFADTGDRLERRGVTDLQSLQSAVPGLLVSEGGSFQRRISIRGIGNAFGSSSLVGIYVDEASVTTIPANQLDLRIFDIDRVEVLKGPQGTLYGEGSVGGTIRYITNNPEFDRIGGSVKADLLATQDGDLGTELRAVLNVPLTSNLGVRVAGQYVHSGGWIDQPALGKTDINSYDLFNIRGKLLWRPTDRTNVTATVIVHHNDVGAQNIGEDANGNYTQYLGDLSTPSGKDRFELYNLTLNHDFGGVSLISSTSKLNAARSTRNLGNECCVPLSAGDGYWNILFDRFSVRSDIFSQELRLVGARRGGFAYTAGAYYRDADTVPQDVSGFRFGEPGGTPGVNFFTFGPSYQQERSRSWAGFGELSYLFPDTLEVGAGLRYFEDHRRFRTAQTGPYQQQTFDTWNPRFYIRYALTSDASLYVNAAKGFRSGGFNAVGQPTYDPESVWTYEAGFKGQLFSRLIYLEAAGFFSKYNDYQIVGVIPTLGLTATSNAGKAEIKGIEVNATIKPSRTFNVGLSATYMDTDFTRINVTSSSYQVGDPLDLVPEYAITAWAEQRFPIFGSEDGFVRVDYSRQGKSFFRNRSLGPNYVSTSDEVDLLNARLGAKRGALSVEVYATNMLNDRGYLGPIVIERNASRARPRTFGLQLGVEF